jgi:hypothetical protein
MNLLKEFGCDSYELTTKAFPSNFEPKLFELWTSFIATRTAYDLFQLGGKDKAKSMEYAVLGFLSMCSARFSKVLVTNKTLKIPEYSTDNAVSAYKTDIKALKEFVMRKSLKQYLKPADVSVRFTGRRNPAANAYIAQTVSVFLAFIPKYTFSPTSEGVRKTSLGRIIMENSNRIFDGTVPESLQPRGTLNQKLDKSTFSDVYPRFDVLVDDAKGWSLWKKELNLSVARARGDVLALRVDLDPSEPMFMMRQSVPQIEKAFEQKLKSAFLGAI